MSGAQKIEAQYLQAAAAQASSYYQAIWQKMGFILVIQYGGIGAAYVLRGTPWSFVLMFVALFFSWGLTWAIDHDVNSREVLIAQADYIALGLNVLFEERPPSDLRTPFGLDPFPVADHPHFADRFKPIVSHIMSYTTWLYIQNRLFGGFRYLCGSSDVLYAASLGSLTNNLR